MQTSVKNGRGVRGQSRYLAIALVLIVGARLGLATLVYARPELAVANDSDRYIPIANAILNGTAYAWSTDRPGELLNTVGYPLFLAGVFAAKGSDAGDIALAQLLLSGGAALGLFFLLSGPLGPKAAFLGSVILALDPLSALWSMTILTETLFAAALGIGATLLVSWTHSHRRLMLVLAGGCVGLACLVKPFALLVSALWVAALMFFPDPKAERWSAKLAAGVRRASLFVLPIVLLVSPWFVRNSVLWDCPSLSSVDRVTLRDYMAGKVLAESSGIDLAEAQVKLQVADPGVCPRQTGKYWRIILDNPAIYAKLHIAGTVPVVLATNFDRWLQYFGRDYALPDLWRPYMAGGLGGLVQVLGSEILKAPQAMAVMLGLTAFQMLMYILALTAAAAAARRPEDEYRWIAVTLLGTVAILILTPGQGGHERFRVPVQPVLAILICYGVAARGGLNPWGRARPAAKGGS